MKKLLLAASLIMMTSFVNAQYLVSATQVAYIFASDVKWNLENQGFDTDSMELNNIRFYKVTYNTTDVHGAQTVATGALYVPQIECDTLPLVSYQHGTVFHKEHVPSNWWSWVPPYLFSGNGYITTLPDYLGLGDNPGLHPYVHWESEATASLDLIRAAREFLNAEHQIWDNNQLFITGYSQGGHSTMAIHKYVTVNNLQDEFNIVASAPMSGPFPLYDAQFPGMFDEDSSYYRAEFIPYVFASYQLVYGNLYTFYNEYYDPPYDSIIADWLASGAHDADEWEALIPENFYDFMQDSVVDNMLNDPDHPVNVNLRENDLHNWIPAEPVHLLYCGMDSMVYPENSIMTKDTMMALGASEVLAIDIDPNGTHETCNPDMYVFDWFNSLSVECEMVYVSISSINEQPEISLYPNPFSTFTTIEYVIQGPETADITIFNHLGQIVESTSLGNVQPGKQQYVWDAESLPSGVYFYRISVGDEVSTGKIIKR